MPGKVELAPQGVEHGQLPGDLGDWRVAIPRAGVEGAEEPQELHGRGLGSRGLGQTV